MLKQSLFEKEVYLKTRIQFTMVNEEYTTVRMNTFFPTRLSKEDKIYDGLLTNWDFLKVKIITIIITMQGKIKWMVGN